MNLKFIYGLLLFASLSFSQVPTDGLVYRWQQGTNLVGTTDFVSWTDVVAGLALTTVNDGAISGDTLIFDGVDDYIGLGADNTNLDPGTNSFSFIVKYKYGNDTGFMLSNARGALASYAGWSIYTLTSNRVSLVVTDGTNQVAATETVTQVNGTTYVGVWVCDQTADRIYTYINGTIVTEAGVDISSVTGSIAAPDPYYFRMGTDGSGGNDWLGGILDVSYYNKALSQAEVTAAYDCLMNGNCGDDVQDKGFKERQNRTTRKIRKIR